MEAITGVVVCAMVAINELEKKDKELDEMLKNQREALDRQGERLDNLQRDFAEIKARIAHLQEETDDYSDYSDYSD